MITRLFFRDGYADKASTHRGELEARLRALRAPSIPAQTGACTGSPAAVRWVNLAECRAGCPGACAACTCSLHRPVCYTEVRIVALLDNAVLKGRRRAARPERILIGDEQMVRNDVLAQEQGVSERSLNRGDAHGAPYIMLFGVKYRPLRRYHEFLLKQIQIRNQSSRRRRQV
jgi:hypothetical protein